MNKNAWSTFIGPGRHRCRRPISGTSTARPGGAFEYYTNDDSDRELAQPRELEHSLVSFTERWKVASTTTPAASRKAGGGRRRGILSLSAAALREVGGKTSVTKALEGERFAWWREEEWISANVRRCRSDAAGSSDALLPRLFSRRGSAGAEPDLGTARLRAGWIDRPDKTVRPEQRRTLGVAEHPVDSPPEGEARSAGRGLGGAAPVFTHCATGRMRSARRSTSGGKAKLATVGRRLDWP